MKYNITLNQPLMIENNLNVSQWCILDIISVAPTWCEAVSKDNDVYYWIARQKIAEELKALDLKADTIYRYIKKLVELGFIEHIKDGKKDLIRLSKKGKNLFISMSEKNPSYYVGKKSEQNSEKNPTYNNTSFNNNTDNKKNRKKDLVVAILKDKDLTNINKTALNEWLEYKEWNYKQVGITKLLNLLKQYTLDIQQEIIDTSIINGYKGIFKPKGNNIAKGESSGAYGGWS